MHFAISNPFHHRLLLILVTCQAAIGALLPQAGFAQAPAEKTAQTHLILAVGAAGEAEYASEFELWSDAWQELARQRQWEVTRISQSTAATSPREALMSAISELKSDSERLWIVLLGHGTYSGDAAKFNLAGPDFSAQELSQWLKGAACPLVIVNCSSASAPFLPQLSGPERVVLTATRSGNEINFARFGQYLSQSLSDLAADIDHDLEVSLLEAFLAATAKTERFYREEARLTTEHALLDDNGDRAGTSADFYRGTRPVKESQAGASIDGDIASRLILFSSPEAPQFSKELDEQRRAIELQIEALRKQKGQVPEADYLSQLEQLMLQLSDVYRVAEAQ